MFSVRNPWARAGIKRSSQERKIASPRMTSEEQARKHIDALLLAAGWHICDVADANIHAALGVAIREFPLDSGFGFADYLLYVDGKACGVIEAKKEGMPLTGVEVQSGRYAKGH